MVSGCSATSSTRISAKNAATFVAALMNATTGVGAPWYTSGVHMWNGAAEILKPNPITSRPIAEQRERLRAGLTRRARRRSSGIFVLPGRPVGHRDPVQEERRGERPQQEVLHRGLVAPPAAEPGQHVQRQRQDLQRDEHDDQVVRGRDQHHPGRREQHERIELPAEGEAPARGLVRVVDTAEGRGDHEHDRRDDREPVGGDRVAEDRRVAAPVPELDRGDPGAGEPRQRERQMDGARAPSARTPRRASRRSRRRRG